MLVLLQVRHLISVLAQRVTRTDEGASMVEYALLLALVAVVCIAAVTLLGRSAADKFSTIGNAVSGA